MQFRMCKNFLQTYCYTMFRDTLSLWNVVRCHKLFESGKYDVIYVHGLGAAVDRAINIALQLKATSTGCVAPLEVSANTSTINLIDDYIPVDDEHEPKTRSRHSSAIHIKVFRAGTNSVSDTSSSMQKATSMSSVAESHDKVPVDTRTSDGPQSQQQPAASTSQKQKKKKPTFTKLQLS